MREIKFRAWDKNKEYMHYNVEDVYDDSSTENKPYLGDFFGGVLSDENMEVMQFTGLKDKNGKEIYEGDIVITTRVNWYCPGHPQNNTDLIDQVEVYWDEKRNVMSTRTFDFERLKSNPNHAPFSSSGSLGSGWNDERADKNICEVIGNIYENPELTKHNALNIGVNT